MDGHFCLLNKFAEVTKIPENIYENINPIGIIIVTDSIEKIFERLAERDGIKYDLKLLEAFQSEELEYSEQIAKRSNIPYFVHQTENNEGEMRNFLEKLLE